MIVALIDPQISSTIENQIEKQGTEDVHCNICPMKGKFVTALSFGASFLAFFIFALLSKFYSLRSFHRFLSPLSCIRLSCQALNFALFIYIRVQSVSVCVCVIVCLYGELEAENSPRQHDEFNVYTHPPTLIAQAYTHTGTLFCWDNGLRVVFVMNRA